MTIKLSLARRSAPISKFPEFEANAFTVLTGLNGVGKTQLLKSIKSGVVSVEGIDLEDIHYYNPAGFMLKSEKSANISKIEEASKRAWLFLSPANSTTRGRPWLVKAESIYRRHFADAEVFDLSDEGLDDETKQKIVAYDADIELEIFGQPEFKTSGYRISIGRVFRSCARPLHTLELDDFLQLYRPVSSDGDFLSTSLGLMFTKFKIEQMLWCLAQFNEGSSQTKPELEKRFSDDNTPPWVLINKILETVHNKGGGISAFNFAVTTPSDDKVNYRDYKNYTFEPQLVDRALGGPRRFLDLSSGEQILLSLAISIFQSEDGYSLPKLLLLDEIDASLHPSMSRALISILQEIFVDQGTSVILTTHSPSTVALAPEESVVIAHKISGGLELKSEDRGKAIELLSEGFVAFDPDFGSLRVVPEGKIGLLTEGKNVQIFEKLLALHGILNVVLMKGREDRSSSSQLKTFYDLLSALPHTGTILCVWDCDCDKFEKLEETSQMFRYIMPKNLTNNLAKKGLENAFPEAMLEGFAHETSNRATGEKHLAFGSSNKGLFSDHVCSQESLEHFGHFDGLIAKIREITKLL